MIRVVHIQRKPTDRQFSIEEVFSTIRRHLPNDIESSVHTPSHDSRGLFRRLGIALEAAALRGDVLHVTGDIHFATLLLPRRRTVLTIHDCVPLIRRRGLARLLLKLFWFTFPARHAARITVISEKTRKELLSIVALDESKVSVIPDPVSAEFVCVPKTPLDPSNPRILQIGTKPNKNLLRLCEALDGIGVTLEIIGNLSEEQLACLGRFGIRYENEVAVSKEDLVRRYQRADLVTFVSTYEGFGLPIVEAQATATPVVTSRLEPMAEVAGPGACLVDPMSPVSIREGIRRLVHDPDYRESCVRTGLENVTRFRPDNVARMYADLYRSMARRDPVRLREGD